jgi:hypothetical protein
MLAYSGYSNCTRRAVLPGIPFSTISAEGATAVRRRKSSADVYALALAHSIRTTYRRQRVC